MKLPKSINHAMQAGLMVFVDKRLREHKEFYKKEKAADEELCRTVQQEFDELVNLLGKEKKDLLIDYTDHLNQTYFGIDRWYYEQGMLDCQDLYKSVWNGVVNGKIMEGNEK